MFGCENGERQQVKNCNIEDRECRGGESSRDWRVGEKHPPEKRRKHDNDLADEEPPNNFRDIPVFPELSDIQEGNRIFLRKNLVGKAYEDVDHYLDVQFRLLREDFIRPLRKGIAQIKRNYSGNNNKRDFSESLQFHRYVRITYINCKKKYGSFYRVHFDISGLRYIEWENAKRLVYGCLLCLSCDNFKENMMFAVVADSNHKDLAKGNLIVELVQNDDGNYSNDEEEEDSSQESEKELGEENQHPTDRNNKRRNTFDTEMNYTMVESEAYFEAYRHVLAGIKETHILPLEKYIVHCSPDMHAPTYLLPSGIEETANKVHYDFSSITKESCDSLKNVEVLDENNWPSAVDLNLDETQAKALKLALTNKLAIIQGPPGTGKTHIGLLIMKTLLDNKKKWFYGEYNCPILITCFTNHALDQFLEGILKLSVGLNQNLVRLGGRSKSEVTAKFTLKELRKKRRNPVPQDIYDKLKKAEYMHKMYSCKIDDTFHRVLGLEELECMEEHLAEQFRSNMHYRGWGNVLLDWLDLTSDTELQQAISPSKNVSGSSSNATEGKGKEYKFQTVNRKIWGIKKEFSETSAVMTDAEVKNVCNVYDLSLKDKWKLYRTWLNRLRTKLRASCDHQRVKSIILGRRLQKLRKNIDAEILQSADVIAATTTGAAKYRDLINELNCKIVVVEEAAEILEAHMITSMPKTTEHLILIGDHQQLKPSPTVYELAKKYKLDTSLFERMMPVIPHVTLRVQHRMRPSIADLLRPHIYEHLVDHESVKHKDNIKGITTAVYFLSHTMPEETAAKGTSKKNQHEADFLIALCKYIISQGYTREQITILTMYSGQLIAFQNKMNNTTLENIRVTTVDNFQGEENEIILLSLVRSNEEQKIGFLGIENRICVALSRAKSALYCIGNMKLLAKRSPLWSKIVDHLEETNGIGESLILKCENHPSRFAMVQAPEDFEMVPEGFFSK